MGQSTAFPQKKGSLLCTCHRSDSEHRGNVSERAEVSPTIMFPLFYLQYTPQVKKKLELLKRITLFWGEEIESKDTQRNNDKICTEPNENRFNCLSLNNLDN